MVFAYPAIAMILSFIIKFMRCQRPKFVGFAIFWTILSGTPLVAHQPKKPSITQLIKMQMELKNHLAKRNFRVLSKIEPDIGDVRDPRHRQREDDMRLTIDANIVFLHHFKNLAERDLIPATLRPKSPAPKEITSRALIVTHASQRYDRALAAKKGIDNSILKAKSRGDKIIFLDSDMGHLDDSYFLIENSYEEEKFPDLVDSETGRNLYADYQFYTDLRTPDHLLESFYGEFDFKVATDEVMLVGGIFAICHLDSFMTIIAQHTGTNPLKIEIPMEAVYMGSPQADDTLLNSFRLAEKQKQMALFLDLIDYYYVPIGEIPASMRLPGANVQKEFPKILKESGFSPDSFTFEIFVNGKLQRSLGKGSKTIRIELST